LSIAYAVHSQKQINENKITIALKYSPRIEGPPPTVEEGGRRRVQLESEMARKDRWWHLGFPSWTW
jgi:hypothetical protein